jgi:hypothetical protein
MAEPLSADEARRIVGTDLSAAEAAALAEWYTALARNVGTFPAGDLKPVEPPLRSTPGPLT